MWMSEQRPPEVGRPGTRAGRVPSPTFCPGRLWMLPLAPNTDGELKLTAGTRWVRIRTRVHLASTPVFLLPPALDHCWVMTCRLKLRHQDSTSSRSMETQPACHSGARPQGWLTTQTRLARTILGGEAASRPPLEGDWPGEKTQPLRAADLPGNQFAGSPSLTCATGKVCAGHLGLSAFQLQTAVSLRQSARW